MAGSRARGGRRRRVLCEEARAQASIEIATGDPNDDQPTPRYGEQASIENHPQITDYIPRRRRTVLLTVAGLVGVATACQGLAMYAPHLAARLPGLSETAISEQLAGGIVSWASAATLLVIAAALRIVYSLRRHRVDDQHGRYRVWRWVAAAALLASVNSVVGMHTIAASLAMGFFGSGLTAGGAEWWLAPVALIGCWLAMGIMIEIVESRLAALLAVAAAATYLAAAVGTLGYSPEWLGPAGDLFTRSLPLAGHALALGAAAFFARHVVLDVQGLIEHAAPVTVPPVHDDQPEPPVEPEPAVEEAEDCQWIDGSEPESDEDGAPRKLSKAERKRLRKEKERRRAA